MKPTLWRTSLLIGLFLGCEPANPIGELKSSNTQIPLPVQTQRFIVNLVQVVDDPLAYNGKRGIYMIKDLSTEKEFVGVSGIGISELGSHNSGDDTVRDER